MALTDGEEQALEIALKLPGMAEVLLPMVVGEVEEIETVGDIVDAARPVVLKIADVIGRHKHDVVELQGDTLVVDADLIEVLPS